MLPRRDDARKKLCCPSNFGALFIGLQVVFFLNCDLEMYNGRLSINASVCDWLILLTSAVSEMKQEGGSMEEGALLSTLTGRKEKLHMSIPSLHFPVSGVSEVLVYVILTLL